jgi:ribosome-associated protein
MLRLTPNIAIEDDHIELHFVRSPGPGGQNVNKVATAVQLRFDVARAGLPEAVRVRLTSLAGKRLTTGGILVLEAHRFRTQERNRQDALERLAALLRKASETPRPRVPTRPTRASRERRLQTKRRRADTKRLRAPFGATEG